MKKKVLLPLLKNEQKKSSRQMMLTQLGGNKTDLFFTLIVHIAR